MATGCFSVVGSRTHSPPIRKKRVEFCTEFLRVYSEGSSNKVYNLVTGDETWVRVYDPKVGLQGKVWVHFGDEAPEQPRRSHHQKKFMASIFFSKTGPVHCDMVTSNKKVNSDYYTKYCLNPMVTAWKSQHRKTDIDRLVLCHDNAHPHTSKRTTGYIKATGFKVLRPPPYSIVTAVEFNHQVRDGLVWFLYA